MIKPTEFEDIAPDRAVWWCPECGRISADRHGKLSMLGWTDQCTLLAVLISESSMVVGSNGRIIKADLLPGQPDPLPGSENAAESHA